MYILVQHTIGDPTTMWTRAQQQLPSLPAHLKLHHSIPTTDGRRAICIWEAESIQVLKDYLDPTLGSSTKNEYFEVINKEGVAVPPALQLA